MECNKDEAIRAKEIAEKKFMEKDYTSAKKFALKAQTLYPELDGLTKILTTYDVHLSAQNRLSNGEIDWYRVLVVNPWADVETIRKQYRKLALILHPDKNNSPGAESAFNLISEAWSLLSDKARRLEYNKHLNVVLSQHGTSTQSKVSSAPPGANGFHHYNSSVNSSARTQKRSSPTVPATASPPLKRKVNTFWTICNGCKTQYEYLRIYLNQSLLCPNCREAFFAEERAPPPSVVNSSGHSFLQKNENSRYHTANNGGVTHMSASDKRGVSNSIRGSDLQGNHYSKTANAGSAFQSASIGAQASSVMGQAHLQVKRDHERAEEPSEWDRSYAAKKSSNSSVIVDHLYKKRRSDGIHINGYGSAGFGNVSEPRRGYVETQRLYGFSGTNNKPDTERDLSAVAVRKMLIAKAQSDIHKKLEEWSSSQVKLKGNEKQNFATNNRKKYDDSAGLDKGSKGSKRLPGSPSNDSNNKEHAPLSINVPDPDFHNFDLDRTESAFGGNQVWAAYDDADGMPRYYARIHEVISMSPFKMKISWLNSRNSSEFGPLNWIDSGFQKTCGNFRTGKHEISKTLNSFSHKVKWTKCQRGIIRILPSKGDIWALYKNWSPDWNEETPEEVVHQYEMVEVVSDYDEEQGISVMALIKVAGFKTVFRNNTDSSSLRRIPKEEMFRFSHQVPDRLLTGEEAQNAPRGCWDLDPAATPLELLQVEANKAQPEPATKTDKQTKHDFTTGKTDQTDGNVAEAETAEGREQDKNEK
ncbi:hypothetical protein K2173_013035 [Erythroxylum novogranatense]|uniref:J domain-containing protein n=1 Tax=Erythroxylum novogranatense TaxID=1862640 RepID=A0AAV8S6P9_9ROSI|nr:hypothetical protein K2173_013035 [Erythroxylum novogranatense]